MAEKQIPKRTLDEQTRTKYCKIIADCLAKTGEEILITSSHTFCFPIVNGNGDDDFVSVAISVPSGSRDGEAYDGYAESEFYAEKVKKKKIDAEKRAEQNAKKIARDKAMREAKAKARAEHQAEKQGK